MSWTRTDDPLVARVLDGWYGLTAIAVDSLERESVNGMYRAHTGSGPVVVKRLGRPGSVPWLDYQARTLDALRDNGFPVPAGIRARDGRATVPAEGYQWQVCRYVESRPFVPGDEVDVDAAAACLDALHALAPRLPADSPPSPIQDVEPWLRAGEADLAELDRTVREVAPDRAADLYRSYRTAWEQATAELPATDYFALPRAGTHGEFVSSNVLYAERGVAAVVDWDAVQVRPRVSDVARGALFFARRARGGIEIFEPLVPRFIEGATRSAPLSSAELAAVIPFLQLYFLPACDYLRTLAGHDRSMLDWYLGWTASGAVRVRSLLAPILAVR